MDGEILVGGQFSGANSIGGQTRNRIARLDATTGLADSFDPNANNWVRSIVVQADGKILTGGLFTSIGGQTRNRIARLDTTTSVADSFDPNANFQVDSIAVQTDGKILVGGAFNGVTSIGGQTRNYIARLETNGTAEQTLNLNAVGNRVRASAVQPDGKTLIGGSFTTVLGVTRNNIARLNANGTLDLTFDPNANNEVDSITVQADGRILAGGNFTNIGGQMRNYIARLDPTTGVADPLNPNPNFGVDTIATQPDGTILIGGRFTSVLGTPRNYIARLNTDGTLDANFDPNANNEVTSIARQPDGRILVGGTFSGTNSIHGQTRNYIARLDPVTGSADSFNPNPNFGVDTIATQPDGRILIGGKFTSVLGTPRNYIARINTNGTLDTAFDPNANNEVYSIALQGDGKILAGGLFTSIQGQTRNHIARLDPNTGSADLFNPNAAGGNAVDTIATQPDGKVLAGGNFTSIGGQTRNVYARLTNDTVALQDLGLTQTTNAPQHLALAQTNLTWTRGGSSPQLTRVTFEYSIDNVSYTLLGDGTAAGSDWTLTGVNLPTGQNLYIRARGYYRCGYQNGSESITESVLNAFIPLAITISLPVVTVDTSVTTFTQPVTTSTIDAADNLIGFQGDFTFDSTVVTFQNPPVVAAGLTASNWNVSGNVLPGGARSGRCTSQPSRTG